LGLKSTLKHLIGGKGKPLRLDSPYRTICTLTPDVLVEFTAWWQKHELQNIWWQSATFDALIIEGAYHICNLEVPWEFHRVRDTRTVYDVCGFDYKSIAFVGEPHNALDDACHQVKLVQAALAHHEKSILTSL
jgi:hypothetical protein